MVTGQDREASAVAELLQQDSSVKSDRIFQRIRALGYQGGITVLRDHLRRVRLKPSETPITGGKQEAFDWMRAVLQGAVGQSELADELRHVTELDKLINTVTEERLSSRNKAMAVLARERGFGQTCVCSFLYLGKKTATKYWRDYKRGGTAALLRESPMGARNRTTSGLRKLSSHSCIRLLPCTVSADQPGGSPTYRPSCATRDTLCVGT
jgi:hypothetical protein